MATRGSGSRGVRGRRKVMAGAVVIAALVGIGVAAGAAGGIDLTPSSGPPGTDYSVQVTCGDEPLIYQGFAQGDHVPGTIPPKSSDELTEVSPSLWQVDATAGDWDSPWYATCGDAQVGNQRFNSVNPQLWFGPRPSCCGWGPDDQRTELEGTDCPSGSTVSVQIRYDGDIVIPHDDVPIDELGDWSVPLPKPLGSAEMTIDASCGSVTYDQVQLTTTSTVPELVPPTVTTPPPTTPTTPTAPGAQPQPGSADYTG